MGAAIAEILWAGRTICQLLNDCVMFALHAVALTAKLPLARDSSFDRRSSNTTQHGFACPMSHMIQSDYGLLTGRLSQHIVAHVSVPTLPATTSRCIDFIRDMTTAAAHFLQGLPHTQLIALTIMPSALPRCGPITTTRAGLTAIMTPSCGPCHGPITTPS